MNMRRKSEILCSIHEKKRAADLIQQLFSYVFAVITVQPVP
jgi:hypothetical protein